MQLRHAFVLVCIGMALSACARSETHPVAPMEALSPPRNGPPSDSSGTLYGDADQVVCNLTLSKGPVELPARSCVDGGGTIQGEAFGPLLQPGSPHQPTPGRSAAIEVPLSRRAGGVHYVPVKINDALTLDFLLDSGSASVSMPADVVLALVRLGTLAPGDFLGSRDYRLADGSSSPSQTFRIRSLEVGGIVLEGVTGSMAPVQGTLLLGQSFLGQFRSWSIDNDRQVLVLEGRR